MNLIYSKSFKITNKSYRIDDQNQSAEIIIENRADDQRYQGLKGQI